MATRAEALLGNLTLLPEDPVLAPQPRRRLRGYPRHYVQLDPDSHGHGVTYMPTRRFAVLLMVLGLAAVAGPLGCIPRLTETAAKEMVVAALEDEPRCTYLFYEEPGVYLPSVYGFQDVVPELDAQGYLYVVGYKQADPEDLPKEVSGFLVETRSPIIPYTLPGEGDHDLRVVTAYISSVRVLGMTAPKKDESTGVVSIRMTYQATWARTPIGEAIDKVTPTNATETATATFIYSEGEWVVYSVGVD